MLRMRQTLGSCRRNSTAISGRRAVIAGRSDIVGKALPMLLLHENAAVTACHSKTPGLAAGLTK
jgi:methylenetetrahydrofolate dehydrogenase (NADP+)/methenyltetrahydrofolate cyclohydrolase